MKHKSKAVGTKQYIKALVREITDDGRLLGVTGSTPSVDRYDEIVDANTWQLDNFKSNPVILWAHNLGFDKDQPPIGRAINVEVRDGKLMFDIQFDMKDSFAADIFRKYKEKFLNAFSVGFIPHAFGEDDEGHLILMNNELLELSAVPVPANPEALQSLRARSFSVRSWKSMLKDVEATQDTHAQEAEDEVDDETTATDTTEDVKPAAESETVDKPAENADNTENQDSQNTDSGITADDKPNTDGEISGGEKGQRTQSPGSPSLEAQRVLLATMREATRQFQSTLALVNKEMKAQRKTQ